MLNIVNVNLVRFSMFENFHFLFSFEKDFTPSYYTENTIPIRTKRQGNGFQKFKI